MNYDLTPVTDAEVRQALSLLKRFPSGLTRDELGKTFRSDRRAREVMAALVERGLAPVITTDSDYGSGKVYRLARTAEEVQEAVATLTSYRRSLDRRIKGLESAWVSGGGPKQPDLFQEAN